MQFNVADQVRADNYPIMARKKMFVKDSGRGFQTHYQLIREVLEREGKRVPEFVFWNVRGDTKGFVARADESGVQMVSGFSSSQLKLFLMNGGIENVVVEATPATTAWDTFSKAVIENKDYDSVREVVRQTL
jgi:hypothetical protein